jgi:hypothetical protein
MRTPGGRGGGWERDWSGLQKGEVLDGVGRGFRSVSGLGELYWEAAKKLRQSLKGGGREWEESAGRQRL